MYFKIKNTLKKKNWNYNLKQAYPKVYHGVFNGRLRCCLCPKRPVYSSKFKMSGLGFNFLKV
jgi:hypothetical protein